MIKKNLPFQFPSLVDSFSSVGSPLLSIIYKSIETATKSLLMTLETESQVHQVLAENVFSICLILTIFQAHQSLVKW